MNIKEIAKHAGVSVSTVSRVLNHPEQVQPETKDHILEIMQQYDYQPNWFARGLNLGKTGAIALLIPDIQSSLNMSIVSGVESIASEKGYNVVLCDTRSNLENELADINLVLDRKIDGIISVNSLLSDSVARELFKDTPFISVGNQPDLYSLGSCLIDFSGAAFETAAHLLKQNLSPIVLITVKGDFIQAPRIIEGYSRAMQEFLPEGLLPVLEREDSVQAGYNLAKRLYAMNQLPRIILTQSDLQAFGIIRFAQEVHVAIPEELALATLRDSPACSILAPPLTSYELPERRLGIIASRMLFDVLDGNAPESNTAKSVVVLEGRLKIRRSCGNIKHIYESY